MRCEDASKNEWEKGKMCKEKKWKKERKMDRNKREEIQKGS